MLETFLEHRSSASGPEVELLLCCARTELDHDRLASVKNLTKEDLNWAYLLQLARQNGIMPLLYWHLSRICPNSVPPATLQALRDHFRKNSQRNLLFTAELLAILRLFDENGVPAIPYKGPVLAVSVYGNVALRQFCDLDILVPKLHALKARDLLTSRGYQAVFRLSGWQEASFLDSRCEFHQVRPEGQIAAEVHWHIVPRHFVNHLAVQELWQRAVPVRFMGTTVLSFSPEDLLLILCVHGTNHGWTRLEWICGIAELVRSNANIEWRRVIQRAQVVRAQRMLYLGLFLATDLLGLELPREVTDQISADVKIKSLASSVRAWLFDQPDEPPNVFALLGFQLKTRERVTDRIRYVFRLATTQTSADWQFLELSSFLRVFYYLLRPLRLVARICVPLRSSRA